MRPSTPQARIVAYSTRVSFSTNRQKSPPRDSASSPSAPVPVKRSSTRARASENRLATQELKTMLRECALRWAAWSTLGRAQRRAAKFTADDAHQNVHCRARFLADQFVPFAPQLLAQHAAGHFFDLPGFKIAQLKGPKDKRISRFTFKSKCRARA